MINLEIVRLDFERWWTNSNFVMNRILLCLVLGVFSGVAFAAPVVKPLDERPMITAVDIKKGTLSLTHTTESNSITTKYLLDPNVTVEIGGQTASLKALKVGLHVHLFTLGSGMDDPAVITDLDLN